MNIAFPRRSDENLLCLAFFVALLLSGAVQYYNIFVLAGLGGVLSFFLLQRTDWVIRSEFVYLLPPVSIYILYVFALDFSAEGLLYIIFRLYDFIFALLIINFSISRNVNFASAFNKVIKIFAIHAFVNWIFVSLFFSAFSSAAGLKSYQFLYLFFGMNEQYFGLFRSQGLFWEPGILQIYMNFGLVISLFVIRSRPWALFFLLNVLLTQSTTGVTIAATLLGVKFFGESSRMTWSSLFNRAFVLILLTFFLVFTFVAIEDKFFGDRLGSFLARSYDLQVGLSVVSDYPHGIGFNPKNYLHFAENEVYGIDLGLEPSRDQTNGWLILFISSGVFWGFLIFYRLLFQNLLNDHRFATFIVLFPSLVTEPIIFSPFVMFFILFPKIRSR